MSSVFLWNVMRNVISYFFAIGVFAVYGYAVLSRPFSWKRIVKAYAVVILPHIVSMRILAPTFMPLTYLLNAGVIACACFILWKPIRGTQFFFHALLALGVGILTDFLSLVMMTPHYTRHDIYYFDDGLMTTMVLPDMTFLFIAVSVLSSITIALLLLLFRFIWRRDYQSSRWIHIVRPALFAGLVVITCMTLAHMADYVIPLNGVQVLYANLPTIILLSAVFFILLSYTAQDIRQWTLKTSNRALLQQNSAYEALLNDMRAFRHNIGNMVYGLQGTILSGDIREIEDYYAEMAQKCARINNENIVALNRLKSPYLFSLLLRAVQRAGENDLPFYLSIDENVALNGVSGATLCEILGNLLDNAIEAALESSVPRVDICISARDGFSEIIIANTFSKDASLAFLAGHHKSSKPGHSGLGLASIKRLLRRNSRIVFNQLLRGRYIESILCLYSE